MKRKANRRRRIARRMEIAALAATIYSCSGDETDAHRLLSMMIMLEYYVGKGKKNAAKKLGWSVIEEPATVTPLQLVKKLADSTPAP